MQAGQPLDRFFDHCVGCDYPGTLRRDDRLTPLRTAFDELGLRDLRFHAIFEVWNEPNLQWGATATDKAATPPWGDEAHVDAQFGVGAWRRADPWGRRRAGPQPQQGPVRPAHGSPGASGGGPGAGRRGALRRYALLVKRSVPSSMRR